MGPTLKARVWGPVGLERAHLMIDRHVQLKHPVPDSRWRLHNVHVRFPHRPHGVEVCLHQLGPVGFWLHKKNHEEDLEKGSFLTTLAGGQASQETSTEETADPTRVGELWSNTGSLCQAWKLAICNKARRALPGVAKHVQPFFAVTRGC